MEPTSSNASAKIISALIIGLIVGFIAGAFWQARRLSAPASDTTAAVVEVTTEGKKETPIKPLEAIKTEVKTEAKAVTPSTVPVTAVKTTVIPASSATSAELSVADQTAGSVTLVSVKNVTEPVWIAIRDVKDGKLGNILGAHKSFTAEDAEINLLRPTVAGGTYKAVIYKDVGDASFNYKEDVLLEAGQVEFKAN